MVVVIDNYDSFTYNLVALLASLGRAVRVLRNDETTPAAVLALQPTALVISPGPGRPLAAGQAPAILQHLAQAAPQLPVLGICLGHQLMGELCGAQLVHARQPMHGKVSGLLHTGQGIFTHIPTGTPVMRYHSLTLSRDNWPKSLEITAWADDNSQEIMALRHRQLPWIGLQFHPESILSPMGAQMVVNWLQP